MTPRQRPGVNVNPVTVTGSDPSDLEIRAAMAGQPAGLWLELFAAADLLDARASQVQWTGTIRSGTA